MPNSFRHLKKILKQVQDDKKRMKKLINPLLVIFIAIILRFIPHPANVAPIAAMALFGGAYLNKKYALIVPLIAMFISDLFLGFHQSMPFVYGSFLFTGVFGIWLRDKKTIANVVIASVTSSVFFFLITNFGFWLSDSLYPKTFSGQLQAYYYGLPFFRNTLIGDLLYTGLFFGGYELSKAFFNFSRRDSSLRSE
jgi:uncharacterized membrane protein